MAASPDQASKYLTEGEQSRFVTSFCASPAGADLRNAVKNFMGAYHVQGAIWLQLKNDVEKIVRSFTQDQKYGLTFGSLIDELNRLANYATSVNTFARSFVLLPDATEQQKLDYYAKYSRVYANQNAEEIRYKIQNDIYKEAPLSSCPRASNPGSWRSKCCMYWRRLVSLGQMIQTKFATSWSPPLQVLASLKSPALLPQSKVSLSNTIKHGIHQLTLYAR